MRPEDSSLPADWLRIADKDLRRARLLMEHEDADGAGFYLQQAVEKYLKALLLANGCKLRRTHDLEALLNEALQFDGRLESHRDLCLELSAFYFAERYPLMAEEVISLSAVRRAEAGVLPMIDLIKVKLQEMQGRRET